ncbi:MAG TPA: response regulator transcription factor [Anaerolineales bacterium]|nr:response regulator transcription factor [Anaerolineales bacterium]
MRVLVVDDHSLFRDGIVSLLEAAGYTVVGQAGDGQAAIEAARRTQPDLVLMDITMPHMSGLEALRQIRVELPDVKVVMLTVSDDDTDLLEAIKAGASGYLVKNLNAEEFLQILSGLEHGEVAMTRQTTARLIHGLTQPPPPQPDGRETLTAREIELLRLVAQGLSNKAVAQKLSLSENTIKYHLKNILQKLGVQNRTEAASYAIRAGLLKPTDRA